MYTDTIADMLTRLRNANMAWKDNTSIPYSKLKQDILEVLKTDWYLSSVEIAEEWKFKVLNVSFWEKKILNLRKISKWWQRIYVKWADIKPVMNWYWMSVVSTSQWVMPWYKAYKAWIWWELMFEIY